MRPITDAIGKFAGKAACPRCLNRQLDNHLDANQRPVARMCKSCPGIAILTPLDDKARAATGVVPTAEPFRNGSGTPCPGCGARLMWPLTADGHIVDQCVACHCVWVADRRKLPAALTQEITSLTVSVDEAMSEEELHKLALLTRLHGAHAAENAARARAQNADGVLGAASFLGGSDIAERAVRRAEASALRDVSSAQSDRSAVEAELAAFAPAAAAAEAAERRERATGRGKEKRDAIVLVLVLGGVIGIVVALTKLGLL